MSALNPYRNDTEYNLLFKIAWNLYSYAINFGVTGINPPSMNDTDDVLLKKAAYISAKALDIHP